DLRNRSDKVSSDPGQAANAVSGSPECVWKDRQVRNSHRSGADEYGGNHRRPEARETMAARPPGPLVFALESGILEAAATPLLAGGRTHRLGAAHRRNGPDGADSNLRQCVAVSNPD